MIKLQIGDIVMLRSGSQPMTVFEFREELVEVVWHHGGLPMRDTYHFLELVQLITKDVKFEDQVGGDE